MRSWNVFYAALSVAALAAACASSRPGGVGDDGDDGDGGAEPDARPDGDPGPPPDAGPPTTIYVSIEGADSSFGTAEWPLRHVAAGIARAQTCTPNPCLVRIAEGVYEEEVALASGVDLEGGWNRGFSARDVLIYAVVITSDAPTTMTASGLNAETIVEGLTVRGADLSTGIDGAASTALVVRDSGDHLRLRGARVEGGRGARGDAGNDGTLQQCTALGGAGGQGYDCGSRVGELGNAGGDAASGGAPGGGGNSNCPSACPLVGGDGISDGGPGGNGANGGSGLPGTAVIDDDGTFDSDVWIGIAGGNGGRGLHGTGGSGGGSGGSKRFRVCFGCGTLDGGRGGDGARGGCGGNGGSGERAVGAHGAPGRLLRRHLGARHDPPQARRQRRHRGGDPRRRIDRRRPPAEDGRAAGEPRDVHARQLGPARALVQARLRQGHARGVRHVRGTRPVADARAQRSLASQGASAGSIAALRAMH
jgi:hypothetical protein